LVLQYLHHIVDVLESSKVPARRLYLIQLDQLEEQFIMQDDYHPIPASWSDNELAVSHANQVVVQSEAKLHARHPAEVD
jgi:hypothetical protein